MADVFLSYAREDRERAEQVARGLQAAGIQVFWDNEIPPGQTWADYIETKLTQCKALIVLWSQTSTKSQWVREEARMGRDKGVLIPAMIDDAQAPFGFGEVQAANLSTWNGDANHADWKRFLDAVRNASVSTPRPAQGTLSGAPPRAAQPQAAMSSMPAAKKGGVPTWAWIAGGVVGVIVLLAVLGSLLPDQSTQQTAAVNTPPEQTQPVMNAPPATAPASGTTDYQQQILARLGQVEQAFVQQGYTRVAAPVTGQLSQGQSQDWPISLNVGAEFRIIGVCDSDCGDLDLSLFDGYGNEISRDNSSDATPVVSVVPSTSGQFGVQAHMYNCTRAPCYYALVLYGKSQ